MNFSKIGRKNRRDKLRDLRNCRRIYTISVDCYYRRTYMSTKNEPDHYHDMRIIIGWMHKRKGVDVNIVVGILQQFLHPLKVRIHFVVGDGCNGCCGNSIMSVVPLGAPDGPERWHNEDQQEVKHLETIVVGIGDRIYLQENWSHVPVCCNGWNIIETHKALSDCKVAGEKDDETEYGPTTEYTWYDLLQELD